MKALQKSNFITFTSRECIEDRPFTMHSWHCSILAVNLTLLAVITHTPQRLTIPAYSLLK